MDKVNVDRNIIIHFVSVALRQLYANIAVVTVVLTGKKCGHMCVLLLRSHKNDAALSERRCCLGPRDT